MKTLIRFVLVLGIIIIANKTIADTQQNCTVVCQTINGYTYCHQICT